MKAERPLRVVFFKTDTDHEPVREWLKDLWKEDCKVIGADILTVQYAWPVGKPLVDNLGDGIWEVRSRLDNRPNRADVVRLGEPGNRPAARVHQEAAKDTVR